MQMLFLTSFCNDGGKPKFPQQWDIGDNDNKMENWLKHSLQNPTAHFTAVLMEINTFSLAADFAEKGFSAMFRCSQVMYTSRYFK